MLETSELCISLTMTMIALPRAFKYVAKHCRDAAQEALRKGKVVACRFWFFHMLVFTYVRAALNGIGETITKRIRRRG